MLDEVRELAQGVLREWKSERLGRKQALKKLSDARERLEPAQLEPKEDVPVLAFADILTGQRVSYRAWNKAGVVLEKDERRKQVKVDFSGVAMWVAFAELTLVDGPERKAPVVVQASSGELGYSLTLDVRGRRADEAIVELEKFLDAALLRGAGSVEIIHGRGTGALRREIHEVLRRSPSVAGFALANEDRGGDGMTEVTLK